MENKKIVLIDDQQISISVPNAQIDISIIDGKLNIIYNGDIKLQLNGTLEIDVDGRTDFTSRGIYVDSMSDQFKTPIHLNGRMAKKIKDLPESIEYRRKKEEDSKRAKIANEFISSEKVPILESIVPKQVKGENN